MKRTFFLTALGFVLVATPAVLHAQQPPATPTAEAETDRVLDFEGDVIETSFLKPDASLIEGELRKGGASLLKIRKDFVAEIVKSAEDI